MKLLYAPWRSKYFSFGSTKPKKLNNECPFCSKFDSKDPHEHLILNKFKHCLIMLNLFPYNAGHILVMPIKHTSSLNDLSKEERGEIMEVINSSIQVLEEIFKPDGINMGLNKGKASGGSVQEHIHFHVLPRFVGDTNFLSVIADTKQIPFNIYDVYEKLLPYFQTIKINT